MTLDDQRSAGRHSVGVFAQLPAVLSPVLQCAPTSRVIFAGHQLFSSASVSLSLIDPSGPGQARQSQAVAEFEASETAKQSAADVALQPQTYTGSVRTSIGGTGLLSAVRIDPPATSATRMAFTQVSNFDFTVGVDGAETQSRSVAFTLVPTCPVGKAC